MVSAYAYKYFPVGDAIVFFFEHGVVIPADTAVEIDLIPADNGVYLTVAGLLMRITEDMVPLLENVDTVFIAIDGSDGYSAHIQSRISIDKVAIDRIIAYCEIFFEQRGSH